MYSEEEAKNSNKGWFRGCFNICYYQNARKRKTGGFYYTLAFAVTFQYKNDNVYFAHSYPYAYTDLCKYLTTLENDPKKKDRLKRRVLCQTIAGNNCEMLIITNYNNDQESFKARKGIVITGRVHPGETAASFMIQGLIDFLVGPTLNAKLLRDNFVIKVF